MSAHTLHSGDRLKSKSLLYQERAWLVWYNRNHVLLNGTLSHTESNQNVICKAKKQNSIRARKNKTLFDEALSLTFSEENLFFDEQKTTNMHKHAPLDRNR